VAVVDCLGARSKRATREGEKEDAAVGGGARQLSGLIVGVARSSQTCPVQYDTVHASSGGSSSTP